ncbi:MAG: hypothetical protein U5L11_16490 [Arhodomonas sp.]|nr:hypothetical protein [Arhodomonas sp.]
MNPTVTITHIAGVYAHPLGKSSWRIHHALQGTIEGENQFVQGLLYGVA